MPGIRDHEPIVIEEFNGWWDRGDPESAPSDHFITSENVQYFSSGVETRLPIDKLQPELNHLTGILRAYNYVMQTGPSLLVLTKGGNIYHLVNGAMVGAGPILAIATMEDFGFVSIAGRAYITPFHSLATNLPGGLIDLGISGQFVYVYKGDGVPARKAAGKPPSNKDTSVPPLDNGKVPFLAYNSPLDGVVTAGIHIIALANGGGPLGTEVFPTVEAPGNKVIQLTGIPGLVGIGPIVMTRAIDPKLFKPAATGAENGNIFYRLKDPQPIILNGTAKINTADIDLTTVYAPLAAPPAPGAPGTGSLLVEPTLDPGFCDIGFHLVGIVYETDTGFMTAPGPEYFGGNTYVDVTKSVWIRNIPFAPSLANPALGSTIVIKRHIVSTKTIFDYNGDQKGYQFFFVPKGTIENNNPATHDIHVSYYDSDLVADASHLLDNFAEIPAGVRLTTYHSRMALIGDPSYPKKLDGTPDNTKPDNRSVVWLSAPGEPEAINQVDGLIVVPLDGSPLVNIQEFRDILYVYKRTRTFAYSDNSDEPTTWKEEVLDQGTGTSVHGIATVLDSGGVNVDFLLVADFSGLMLFNGTYARPELTWKIEDYWTAISHNNFRQLEVVNDTLNKKIWVIMPEPFRHHVLYGDYGNGLDSKNIKWSKWIFNVKMATVTLIETDRVIFGASGNI